MKRVATWFGTILMSAGLWGLPSPVAQSVQLSDGKVYFVQPPSLVSATTTQNSVYSWGATYYFTIQVPENAGEPLQKVIINQYQGADRVRFSPNRTEVFEAKARRQTQDFALKDVTLDRETRSATVVFDPPVPPGKTVTIGLRPVRNPDISGVYLFGVTAYPPGENVHGQFLGYGRLHFYDRHDSVFRRSWLWR